VVAWGVGWRCHGTCSMAYSGCFNHQTVLISSVRTKSWCLLSYGYLSMGATQFMTINTTLMQTAWSIGVMHILERMCRCGGFHCRTRPQQSTIMFDMKSLLAASLWKNTALADSSVLHGTLFFTFSVVELGRVDVGLTCCYQLPMGLSDLSGGNSPPPPPQNRMRW
jgi:hypothetical protein